MKYSYLFILLLAVSCQNSESTSAVEIIFPVENQEINYLENEIKWFNNSENPIRLILGTTYPYLLDTILKSEVSSYHVWLEPETKYEVQLWQSNNLEEVNFSTSKPLEKIDQEYKIILEKHADSNTAEIDSLEDILRIKKMNDDCYSFDLLNLDIHSKIRYLYYNSSNVNLDESVIYGSLCQAEEEPCILLFLQIDLESFEISIEVKEDFERFYYKAKISI